MILPIVKPSPLLYISPEKIKTKCRETASLVLFGNQFSPLSKDVVLPDDIKSIKHH